jgi:tetratricopeptide (TPR) repeat protein
MFKRRNHSIVFFILCALHSYTAFAQKDTANKLADSLLIYAAHHYQQDLQQSLTATRQALSLGQEHKLPQIECRAYIQLGSIYTIAGLYINALEEFHKALALSQQNKWLPLEAETLTSLGNVYYHEDSLPKALTYYHASLKKLEGVTPIAWPHIRNLTNIGIANKHLGNLQEGEHYIRLALKKSIETNNQRGLCYNYQNLASLHTEYGRLDSARYYYSLALKITQEQGFIREQIHAYEGMASVYRKKQQWEESKQMLLKALELSKQISANTMLKQLYYELSKQEERDGDFRKALDYYRRYNGISDSLGMLSQRSEQQNFYYLLEAERNLNENKLLKANVAARENELNASLANHQKQVIVIIVSGVALILLLCLMIFLLYHYRQNQKNHQQLQTMHAAIQTQARELEEAYQKIRQHNLELESNIEDRTRQLNQQNKQLIQYAYFNAHKVRGPLARILGLVNLLPKAAHQTEFSFIMNRLHDSAQELDQVVHEINHILEVKQPVNHDN